MESKPVGSSLCISSCIRVPALSLCPSFLRDGLWNVSFLSKFLWPWYSATTTEKQAKTLCYSSLPNSKVSKITIDKECRACDTHVWPNCVSVDRFHTMEWDAHIQNFSLLTDVFAQRRWGSLQSVLWRLLVLASLSMQDFSPWTKSSLYSRPTGASQVIEGA